MATEPDEIANELARLLNRVDEQNVEITATERAAIEGAVIALRIAATSS